MESISSIQTSSIYQQVLHVLGKMGGWAGNTCSCFHALSLSGISLVLSSLPGVNKAGSSAEISLNSCHVTLGLIQVIQSFPTALRE